MPWIAFDKGKLKKKWPWKKVSWKAWARIMREFNKRKPKPKPVPKPTPAPTPAPKPVKIYMFDDVNVSLIPKNAQAVAGYVDGHFRTWAAVEKGWPHAKKLPIAVFGQDNGDALDVEPGDASVIQAAAWVKRQNARWSRDKHDVRLPVVYTSVSWAQGLVNALSKAGLKQRKHYLLWTAHYDPRKGEHLCSSSCGFGFKSAADATQYTDRALGRSLDESVCRAGFWK
jgi:hypothetical protein